ncbi:hypothetical protein DIT71_03285 [Marinobacter vulgaris]|uniref:Uncharacterized protein n=1 Tax=Marinobacter vulgaris TaxID=1928331 RepID=A0A2V4A119_9GAMM|nr:hypothetical protein [Marinobacter vulgaris]PXX92244.1 hypothetical protein DIT71_03285 [Marinobacter vulgaris]TSJ71813.1 hypothetical protein FPC41_06180 [Marinobacter vulgaris]
MKKYLILTLVYLIGCYFLIFEFAKNLTIDFSSALSGLITVSGILLAIVGMWISYSYPEAVQKITQKNDKIDFLETLGSAKRLESLVMTILLSATVILACLFMMVVAVPVVKNTTILNQYAEELRATGVCVIWYLTILQGVAVIKIMRANLSFLHELYVLIARLDLHKQKNPHRKQVEPEE